MSIISLLLFVCPLILVIVIGFAKPKFALRLAEKIESLVKKEQGKYLAKSREARKKHHKAFYAFVSTIGWLSSVTKKYITDEYWRGAIFLGFTYYASLIAIAVIATMAYAVVIVLIIIAVLVLIAFLLSISTQNDNTKESKNSGYKHNDAEEVPEEENSRSKKTTHEKRWVDKDHYRITSADGKQSWLYKADGGLIHSDTCIEVADHTSSGKTYAYEPDPSVIGELFHGGKGKMKSE